ncbi:MAG: 30S ribosomal protein S2 [Candidatus Hadarchaeales archaeon]
MAQKLTNFALASMETYVSHGVHIGTRHRTGSMKKFIYKVKQGVNILDIEKTDERIAIASRFLARYEPKDIVVVSARQYGQYPVMKFGEVTGARTIVGRFIPGTFTNPSLKFFIEPEVLVITDPLADEQPLREAAEIMIPTVGICDSDNETSDIDLIIPANNKSRKSLALVYWLLARQFLIERGDVTKDKPFTIKVEDFEPKIGEKK